MQPLSANLRPDLLTCLTDMSPVLCLPREMHLCRSSSDVPCLPSFCKLLQNPHVWLTFHQVQNPLRLPHKTTLERPKVVRASGAFTLAWTCALRHNAGTFSTSQLPKLLRQWCVMYVLTSKRASRHIDVHFFGISTSKSGPRPPAFSTFDFEMCFAPNCRALFQHLNF